MKLNDLNYFWLAALLVACDPTIESNTESISEPTIDAQEKPVPMVPLPDFATDASCAFDTTDQFSGGDIYSMVDRIFVGIVTNVSFIEEGLSDDCDPRMYEWTLRVEFQVEENLKGSGETAVVLVRPDYLQWNSRPLLKRDGAWLPATSHPPAVELSSTVAWTGESAIQPGQTLLLFARELDGFLFTSKLPWGFVDGDGFRLQNTDWCIALPDLMQRTFSLESLKTELQTPNRQENEGFREAMMEYGYITESKCTPNITPPPFEDGPDGGN